MSSTQEQDGQVAGAKLAHNWRTDQHGFVVECRPSADGEAPQSYERDDQPFEKYPVLNKKEWNSRPLPGGGAIYKKYINGATAEEVLVQACGHGRHWLYRDIPLCRNATACATAHIGPLWWHAQRGRIQQDYAIFRLGLIYDELPDGRLRLRSAPVSIDRLHGEPVQVDQPIYPAADRIYGSKVPVWYWIVQWKLSDADKALLKKVDPSGDALKLAEAALADTERHELGHIKIQREFTPQYFDLVNHPAREYAAHGGPQTATKPYEFVYAVQRIMTGRIIELKGISGWNRVQLDESYRHGDFHNDEGDRGFYEREEAPLRPGLNHILCRRSAIEAAFGK